MNDPLFHIDILSLFSADRQVYRAFDHLVAARSGTLLLVPSRLVVGNIDVVVDVCPVPHEEVYSVLEYPSGHQITRESEWIMNDHVQQLQYLGINPDECEVDYITPMVKGEDKVLRLVHPSGVRYAVVMP